MKTYTKSGKPQELQLLEVNARTMRPETFDTLVSNIKRDGALTQYPFVWLDADGVRHVLSGNHRVRAAIAAGLKKVTWIETADELTEQQRTAIQLSHNAINGEDDLGVLKELFDELTEEEWASYAGFDDETLAKLAAEDTELPEEPQAEVSEDVETFVKLSELFGARAVPTEAAEVIAQAVARMLNRGEVTEKAKWRAIELWAADYLASS